MSSPIVSYKPMFPFKDNNGALVEKIDVPRRPTVGDAVAIRKHLLDPEDDREFFIKMSAILCGKSPDAFMGMDLYVDSVFFHSAFETTLMNYLGSNQKSLGEASGSSAENSDAD